MSTFLSYVLMASLLANGVLAFLWQRSKRKMVEAINRGVEIGRDIESKSTDKLLEGLENENKVTGSIDDGGFLN